MRLYKADGTEVNLQEIENSGVIKLNDLVYYEIHNGVCYVQINNSNFIKIKANNYTTIGTLPVAPRMQYDFCIHFIGDDYMKQSCRVNTKGDIEIYLGIESSFFAGSFCFLIS